MTPVASAAKEEAGVTGPAKDQALGTYQYQKWGGTCTVEVFTMAVREEATTWPEADCRVREWVSVAEARDRVGKAGLKVIIDIFLDHL